MKQCKTKVMGRAANAVASRRMPDTWSQLVSTRTRAKLIKKSSHIKSNQISLAIGCHVLYFATLRTILRLIKLRSHSKSHSIRCKEQTCLHKAVARRIKSFSNPASNYCRALFRAISRLLLICQSLADRSLSVNDKSCLPLSHEHTIELSLYRHPRPLQSLLAAVCWQHLRHWRQERLRLQLQHQGKMANLRLPEQRKVHAAPKKQKGINFAFPNVYTTVQRRKMAPRRQERSAESNARMNAQ